MTRMSLAILLISFISGGCGNSTGLRPQEEDYEKKINSWKDARIERLKSRTGWLNIAGLYWLKEGSNSIGSNQANNIIFPEAAPEFCGSLILKKDSVFYTPFPGTDFRIDGKPATDTLLENDLSGNPTLIESGRFSWFIIRRGHQFGIRLRDYENPAIKKLSFIPAYKIDENMRIPALFVPFDTIHEIEVATVSGGKESYQCPGKLIFKAGRKKCELLPFIEDDRFFIIFGDRTNGTETYGAGRFLYSELPDDKNQLILDFNMAYNPPCAFTSFATCPRPPMENLLKIEIRGGEKEVHIE